MKMLQWHPVVGDLTRQVSDSTLIHIDPGVGIGQDLIQQPSLKRGLQPLITVIQNHDRELMKPSEWKACQHHR